MKLKINLQELVENQIITKDISDNIQAFESEKKNKNPNRLLVIFGVLGAIFVGLGIILILAHNWDNLNRITKTIFAFLPLLISQVLVGFSIYNNKSNVWKETTGTLLFFAIGSSIALISQIYHISGDMSSFLLGWILLTCPLIYLLKSKAVSILHLIFTIQYLFADFHLFKKNNIDLNLWISLGLLLFVFPFYYQLVKLHFKENFTKIFAWLYVICFGILLGRFSFEAITFISFFSLLYLIGKTTIYKNERLLHNPFLVIGSLGTVITLLIASFKDFWRIKSIFENYEIIDYSIIGLFLISIIYLLIINLKKEKFLVNNILGLSAFCFIIIYLISVANPDISRLLVNLVILTIGVLTIKIGSDKIHFGILNYGLLIITILVICRYFDLKISFVLKGLIFLVIGTGFFLTNYFTHKKIKENEK